MKKIILLMFVVFFAFSCSDNSNRVNNNPFLPNYTFSVNVNLDLPQYSSNIAFPGNGYLLIQEGAGIRGIFILNTGTGFLAYEAACPNQALADCSTMILDGISAKCPCDNAKYSLYSGQAAGQQYSLKVYRTELVGRILRVFN